jgi:membrane peptidoglycan carboxypeptidase
MKLEKKEDQPHSFNHPEDPSRVVRWVLLRKHLKKKRQREMQMAARRGISGAALGLVSLAVTLLLIISGFYVNAILKDLPGIDQLEAFAGPEGSLYQPTRYYDRTGQVLIPGNNMNRLDPAFLDLATRPTTDEVWRFTTYLSALMTVADSFGVDKLDPSVSTTVARAIAERLVSDLLLRGAPPSSIRNIQVRFLAARAIQRYGKTNLTDWYLNSADYGHGVLGINSATAFYFNKTIFQINTGEALILAVITLEPAINPIDTPDAFNLSLQNAGAYLLGQGVIDTAVVRQATSSLDTINPQAWEDVADLPAFYTIARQQLSEAIRSNNPERGGIKVITTMDIDIQNRLECALYGMYANAAEGAGCDQVLARSSMLLPSATVPDDLQVNFVLLDPTNGQILAMLGDYMTATGQQKYLQPHPGGSLVTPFIYLNGMLRGLTPATLVWDTSTGLDESIIEQYPVTYMFQGPMSVRTALSGDHLAPAAKLLAGFDQSSVVALMSSFGLHLYASEGMPYTSGVADSLSFAQAFGVFAKEGIKAGIANPEPSGDLAPTAILRAMDGKKVTLLDREEPQEQTVINSQLAFLINDMLTVDKSLAPNIKGSTKTGLSSDGANYWRVVYSPEYVFVMWLGYSDPVGKGSLKDLGVDTVFVRIISDYYATDTQFTGWQPADGITRLEVCTPSGQLPGDACPKTVSEYFLAGTEPTETDSLYKRYPIDAETGRLATVFTDPASIIQQVFFNPPAEELAWAREAGYPMAPGEYSVYQPGNTSGSTVITAPLNFDNLQGKVELTGEMLPADFVSYRLDLGAGLAPTQWLQVGSTINSLPEGKKLGSIDTTKYRNGLYTLRIQVLRSGNAADNSYVVILINNPTTNK